MIEWSEGISQAGNRLLTRRCGLSGQITQEVEQLTELLWIWRVEVAAQAEAVALGSVTIRQGTSRSEMVAKIAARMATSLLRESASALEGQDA